MARASTIRDFQAVGFIHGSAVDDLKFKETKVFANGQSRTNAAVLELIRLDKVRHNQDAVVRPGRKKLKPPRWSRSLVRSSSSTTNRLHRRTPQHRIPVREGRGRFMRYPVGFMIDMEPFVCTGNASTTTRWSSTATSAWDRTFHPRVTGHCEGHFCSAATDDQGVGPRVCIINFNCILRTLELDAKSVSDAYGKVFAKAPMVGFSTYGEEYIGHINQTATMLVLK